MIMLQYVGKCVAGIHVAMSKLQLFVSTWSFLTFDRFKDAGDGGTGRFWGRYGELTDDTFEIILMVYRILMIVAVYASGIAIIVSAIILIWNSRNRDRLGESKKYVVQVLIISALIFSVAGIVELVQSLAI